MTDDDRDMPGLVWALIAMVGIVLAAVIGGVGAAYMFAWFLT